MIEVQSEENGKLYLNPENLILVRPLEGAGSRLIQRVYYIRDMQVAWKSQTVKDDPKDLAKRANLTKATQNGDGKYIFFNPNSLSMAKPVESGTRLSFPADIGNGGPVTNSTLTVSESPEELELGVN